MLLCCYYAALTVCWDVIMVTYVCMLYYLNKVYLHITDLNQCFTILTDCNYNIMRIYYNVYKCITDIVYNIINSYTIILVKARKL